jgi:hypothetical protein
MAAEELAIQRLGGKFWSGRFWSGKERATEKVRVEKSLWKRRTKAN